MPNARRRFPRECKRTKGNVGEEAVNGTTSTDVDAKAKILGEMTIAG